MKTLYQSHLILIGALAVAGAAYAQQPPDLVTSDSMANTAMGTNALLNVNLEEAGCHNTASGEDTLYSDTSGSYNTATGFSSLFSNTTGNNNTAAGYESLYFNSTGSDNTASSYQALYTNTTGSYNTASGYQALYSNTTGSYNSASGVGTLQNNTIGSNNIAEGYQAGYNLTTGSNNIDIGNVGVAAESDVIRIGTKGIQKAAFVAGIYNHPLTGNVVVVDSAGRLGVQAVSSERFKTAIEPMGSNTARLGQLRPVTFHLKTDPKGALQYGLIAEEVAKVYPELVIRDQKGRIDGVRYDELAPMLLNEAQKQQQKNAAQDAEIHALKQQVAELKDLKQQMAVMSAALQKLESKDEFIAQR
jgi:hypothetical protein